ncbi:hypothetical protein EEW87_004265 [Janibacter melonis]|uniref:Head-to-tail adaptor n=1 Tax=Janibacter melonis TaxID=262209 RepID=A0A5P8FKJ8_9MICO|nr:hypothetical protein [Janibacter melonis]QFQ29713.2 hypothetical protein EEW87_004265 [Janibacter melonis]
MYLTPDDLVPFADIDAAKAAAMIEDAEAMAATAAPCLSSPQFAEDDTRSKAVKAVLRGAVLRWHEAGSGVLSQRQESAGPFGHSESFDTRVQRRAMFWPSEIRQLQDLCSTFAGRQGRKAFGVDTAPGRQAIHSATCSVHWGAPCSCGSVLNGGRGPIFETGETTP